MTVLLQYKDDLLALPSEPWFQISIILIALWLIWTDSNKIIAADIKRQRQVNDLINKVSASLAEQIKVSLAEHSNFAVPQKGVTTMPLWEITIIREDGHIITDQFFAPDPQQVLNEWNILLAKTPCRLRCRLVK